MSCYFRHLQDVFTEAGVSVTPANKKEIDRAIHEMLGIAYKDCPTTWKALKATLADQDKRATLIQGLQSAAR